jgi:uncharacterized protein YjdB
MRRLSSLSLALAGATVLGCQSGATSPLAVEADPAPLSVIPSYATLNGGAFLRLTAAVRNADGSKSTPADVRWLSADGTIASVAADGTVQGLREGKVQIVATWHDSRGSSLVTVISPVAKKPPTCLDASVAGTGSAIPGGDKCSPR